MKIPRRILPLFRHSSNNISTYPNLQYNHIPKSSPTSLVLSETFNPTNNSNMRTSFTRALTLNYGTERSHIELLNQSEIFLNLYHIDEVREIFEVINPDTYKDIDIYSYTDLCKLYISPSDIPRNYKLSPGMIVLKEVFSDKYSYMSPINALETCLLLGDWKRDNNYDGISFKKEIVDEFEHISPIFKKSLEF